MSEAERRSTADEWNSRLLHAVTGLLVFETLTGLSIWLLPFSVSNQVAVVLHTAVGIVFVAPYLWYQLRHWRRYRHFRISHTVLTGYFAMLAALALVVSGLVLSWQSLFGSRISYGWDLAHIVATLALVASAVPHVLVLVLRASRARGRERLRSVLASQRRFVRGATLWAAGLGVVVPVLALSYEAPQLHDAFSDDYSYLYGEDRPFAPSLATTTTGTAFDARTLAGSQSCGTGGCHAQIVEEWEVSAHRWSAMDVAFQRVQQVMAEQNGAESTRYCGGCHDPISLFSGTKNVFVDELTNLAGYQEGVSCIACHAIEETDVQGNANYVMGRPERYMFELSDGATARFVSDFLIRAYPRQHVQSLQHKLFKSPEFCAACHKQFIDEEINQVGWVQLQNQYDNWRKSRWNHPGDPGKTIECRECHMPLVESTDPGRGDDLDYNRSPADGKHRSHRFLGANQMLPLVLELPGAEEQVALTEEWLRGELEIPEISDKWQPGPAVPVELVVPERVRAGEQVQIQAVITNNKVGHDFPTGPLDIIQAWLEVSVTDQNGELIYESGRRDADHFIQPGSFIFKAEPVDQYGQLIDRHNLWEMVGVRYRRSVFPGFSDQATFAFSCPGVVAGMPPRDAADAAEGEPGAGIRMGDDPVTTRQVFRAPSRIETLQVSVRLLYRKFDQFLLDFLFGDDSGITAPVTVLSEAEATIRVSHPADE